jgi:hypothetical protein
LGDTHVGSSGGVHEAGGDVQQSAAQLLGFGQGVFAVQEQGSCPGEQVDADEGEFEPRLVDREQPGREPAEPGVLAGPDPVLIRSSTRTKRPDPIQPR